MAPVISALISPLWGWELAGYAAVAAVAIGVAGESIHEFTDWFNASQWWRANGGKASALLLIAALAAELIIQVKTNSISGQIIAFLSDQAASTRERAANLEKQAADIQARAAKAETEAANLMKENVELERTIAPRTIEMMELIRTISASPRVPIFVSPVDQEEPKEVAASFFALQAIKIGDAPTWSVTLLPAEQWARDGVTVQYVSSFLPNSADTSSQQAATAICEDLKAQGIAAQTQPLHSETTVLKSQWPPRAPNNAVVIRVGPKPMNFWLNKMLRRKGLREVPEMAFCTSDEFFEWAGHDRERQLENQREGTPSGE